MIWLVDLPSDLSLINCLSSDLLLWSFLPSASKASFLDTFSSSRFSIKFLHWETRSRISRASWTRCSSLDFLSRRLCVLLTRSSSSSRTGVSSFMTTCSGSAWTCSVLNHVLQDSSWSQLNSSEDGDDALSSEEGDVLSAVKARPEVTCA